MPLGEFQLGTSVLGTAGTTRADGTGTGVGTATASVTRLSDATGTGTGVGTATASALVPGTAAGTGSGVGTAIGGGTRSGSATGTGSGVGTATVPVSTSLPSANSYTIEAGDGADALSQNQQHRRGDGYGVVDPDDGAAAVSINSGTLGQPDTLSVAAGDVLVNGTTHILSPTAVQIEPANSADPRRDVIYVDTAGSVKVAKGAPEAVQPEGENLSRFQFFRPAPDDLADTEATVLAEVWVAAGASAVTTADLRDRRMSTIGEHSIDFETATQADLDTHAGNRSAHHPEYTDENARDAIGSALVGGTDISVTPDDPNDEITVDYTGSAGVQKLTDAAVDNDDGGDIYELPAAADSIRARFGMNLTDTNQMAREDRPLFSTQARTVANGDALTVDPVNGNDANDGFVNPLETLDEAFHRIPIFVQHPFDVKLEAGTYTTAAHSTAVAVFSGWQRTGTQPQLQIIGDRAAPANVVVEGKMGVRIYEAETDDTPEATFSGITFEDEINNKGGVISFSDCRFTGAAAGATGVINGKADGKTNIIDSEFFDGFDYVFNLNNISAEGYIENCTGTVSEYTFRLQRGARGYFVGDSEPIGKKGTYAIQDGAVMIDQDGQTLDRFRSFGDDFGDGRYRGFRVSDSRWFRPEWTIQSGSPIANDGYVHFPDGSSTTQELHLPDQHNLVEDIVFDVRFNSTPTTGQFRIRFNYDWNASGDYYQINLQNDGGLVFSEDLGSFSTLITGTYPQDTSWHTIRAHRVDNSDTSTWELWVDQYSGGGSQGTGSDNGIPDRGTNTWRVAPRNTADAIVEFRNLSVNHFSA